VTELSVRTGPAGKLRALLDAGRAEGVGGVVRRAIRYGRYHLIDKRRFQYFASPISDSPLLSVRTPPTVTISHATTADLGRIRAELFPLLVGPLEYERRYFDRVGSPGFECFLAESGGRLIHYSFVFLDASQSIIRDVPFDSRGLRAGDAFIGPVFTAPDARGMVYVQVLGEVMRFLKTTGTVERLLLFTDAGSVASAPFYERLGFARISGKVSR